MKKRVLENNEKVERYTYVMLLLRPINLTDKLREEITLNLLVSCKCIFIEQILPGSANLNTPWFGDISLDHNNTTRLHDSVP